jgi:hypothetical protein
VQATYNNTAESSPNAIQSPRYQPTSTQVGYEAPVAKVLVLHGDHDKVSLLFQKKKKKPVLTRSIDSMHVLFFCISEIDFLICLCVKSSATSIWRQSFSA